MDFSEGLVAILSSIGVIQGLLIAGYLLQLDSGNRQSNQLLAVVIIGLSIRIGKSVLNYYFLLEGWHRNIGLAGFLLVGPALFFYGKSLFEKSWKFKVRNAWHFIPAVLFLGFGWLIPNQTNNVPSYVSYSLVLVQFGLYLYFSILLWIKYKDQPTQVRSWFRNLTLGVLLLWVFYLSIFLRVIPAYIGGALLHSFLIYAFTYLLLRVHKFNLEKYRKSTIDHSEASEILNRLKQLLRESKLYLKNDLSLNEVAEKMTVSYRIISQVINDRLGQNFSEFINTLRIQEAEALLKDPEMQNESIASIAFDSGFNNLTSFNEAFRKINRMTPSQYRKQFQ